METLDEKINFLLENNELDACIGAVEFFAQTLWKDYISDEMNLESFIEWCYTFGNEDEEYDDEE